MLRRLAGMWNQLGCDVTVLTCDWPGKHAEPIDTLHPKVKIVRLPFRPIRWFGTIWHMRQIESWIRRNVHERPGRKVISTPASTAGSSAPTIIYTSMFKHTSFAAVRAAKRLGVPVVVRAEGAGATGDMAWLKHARLNNSINRTLQTADAFVAPSSAIHQEIVSAGFPVAQVHLIPNGVPITRPAWSADECSTQRAKLGLNERRTFVTTGRLSPEKNLSMLVDALSQLSTAQPISPDIYFGKQDWQWVVVGDGPERARLTNAVEAKRLADRVHFVGKVDDVTPYLRAADLYLLPSHFEGLSVALLEAIALGMPVLASNIPPNQELCLRDEQLLDPNDPAAWASTIHRHDERMVTSTEATSLSPTGSWPFSLEAVAKQHITLFERLLTH